MRYENHEIQTFLVCGNSNEQKAKNVFENVILTKTSYKKAFFYATFYVFSEKNRKQLDQDK